MKSAAIQRLLVGMGVTTAVFGGVYGLAASLSVNSDTLGSGSSVVAACQTGTVSTSYASTYSASAPGYQVTTVTLGGLDTSSGACGGKAAKVTVTGPGASNASLGEQTGTVPSTGTTMAFTFTGVKASDVTGVQVVIAG